MYSLLKWQPKWFLLQLLLHGLEHWSAEFKLKSNSDASTDTICIINGWYWFSCFIQIKYWRHLSVWHGNLRNLLSLHLKMFPLQYQHTQNVWHFLIHKIQIFHFLIKVTWSSKLSVVPIMAILAAIDTKKHTVSLQFPSTLLFLGMQSCKWIPGLPRFPPLDFFTLSSEINYWWQCQWHIIMFFFSFSQSKANHLTYSLLRPFSPWQSCFLSVM